MVRSARALLIFAAALPACGRTPVHALGTPNASTSITDAGTEIEATGLTGWWMKRTIGNCIELESWLHFPAETSGQVARTTVNRDACTKHSVSSDVESFVMMDAHTIDLKGINGDFDHFTFAILDLPPSFPPPALPDGYLPGSRELFDGAYLSSADPHVFHRSMAHTTRYEHVTLEIDLTLAKLPTDAETGNPLSTKLQATIHANSGGATARVEWALSTDYELTDTPPRVRITIRDLESKLAEVDAHSHPAADAIRASFSERILWDPGAATALVDSSSSYLEMMTPPPPTAN